MKYAKRVLLIYPPMVYNKLQSRKTSVFPLGLGYIGSKLERAFDVKLLDMQLEGYDNERLLPSGATLYGLDNISLYEYIQNYQPHYVLISCVFSSMHNRALAIASIVKSFNRDIIVIIGGPHPSALPYMFTKDPNVDYVIIGEGERTVYDLLRHDKITDGIAFKDTVIPKKTFIRDIDALPFPARNLVDYNRYFNIGTVQGLRTGLESNLRLIQMICSRGCPNRCTYCAKSITWGNSYRTRSIDNIIKEIEHLKHAYNVERIAFLDDNLTKKRTFATDLFKALVNMDIEWEAHNGLEVDTLSAETLDAMKSSGCKSFTAAIEFGTQEILEKCRKKIDLEHAKDVIRYAQSIGLDVRGFFMIGYPGETLDTIKRTCDYAHSLNLSVTAFSLATPLPGTELWEYCIDNNIIDLNNVDMEHLSYGGFNLQLTDIPVEKLYHIRKLEWIRSVFSDQRGELKTDLNISTEVAEDELSRALEAYPENMQIRKWYDQFRIRNFIGDCRI